MTHGISVRPLSTTLFALLVACRQGAASSDSGAATDGAAAADARAGDARAPDGALSDASSPEAARAELTNMPPSTSDELTGRMRHLIEALSHDNPELAGDVLFPRDAYLRAFDTPNPGKLYDEKVLAPFRKAVHLVRKRIKNAERATFVSFELGRSVTQLTPKKRDYKYPLWRVRHSKIVFDLDGKTQRVEISEMTAWRGAWYVTKLRGS